MSSEPALLPDDPAMVQDIPEAGDRQTNGRPFAAENASVQPREWEPEEEEEIPLNAEEATVLVLSFLRRMGKRVITPRKAVLTDSVFVVDVELKKAAAVVHIDRNTREIVEFTIQPEVKEPKPLPIPSRRILILLGAVTTVVVLAMVLTFFKLWNVAYVLSQVNSDHLIIGGGVLGVVGIAYLLYRRFRG
jgi:hypothetical protein